MDKFDFMLISTILMVFAESKGSEAHIITKVI